MLGGGGSAGFKEVLWGGGMVRKSADRGWGLAMGSGAIEVLMQNYECPL